MSLSIPMSSIGLPISGSRTFRRAARTSSFVGMTGPLRSEGCTGNDRAYLRYRRMPPATALEIHKALADDTRYRLYRFIGLAGRPVSVREVSRRLNLHPNTVRPHLRRLEEAGLVASEVRRGAVGRPQTLYAVREPEDEAARDYRLLSEMLIALVHGRRATEQAHVLAR